MMMEAELTLQIILVQPSAHADFGLQQGSGTDYKTVQKQQLNGLDLSFTCPVKVKGDRSTDPAPKLSGPFVQGPSGSKFIYIDIGTCAGQADAIWSRRLKIPLTGIDWKMIDQVHADPKSMLQTRVPGTGKDGTPNCATVKPFDGWYFKTM